MVVLLLVIGTIFVSLVFSYLYLWTVSPDVWPAATGQSVPSLVWPSISALLLVLSSAAIAYASRALRLSSTRGLWPTCIAVLIDTPLLLRPFGVGLSLPLPYGFR